MSHIGVSELSAEIIELVKSRCESGFAEKTAPVILQMTGGADALFSIVTAKSLPMSKADSQRVVFRCAYILEKIYFCYPEAFAPLKERFVDEFASCAHPGVQRLFAKMMTYLLGEYDASQSQMESIAQSAVDWACNPNSKVAVRVWCMAILKQLRPHLAWLDECWADIESVVLQDATQGVVSRKNRGWK